MASTDWVEAAGAAIFDAAGRLLLIKENYGRRRWGFPGGAVEPGETSEQAVVREVAEETGLEVCVVDQVGSYALADSSLIAHLFRCEISAGEPVVPETGEIAEVRWCVPEDLSQPQTNLLHHALDDLLGGKVGIERRDLPRIS